MRPSPLSLLLLLGAPVLTAGDDPKDAAKAKDKPKEPPLPAWYDPSFAARRRIALAKGAVKGGAVLLRVGTGGVLGKDRDDLRVVLDHRQAIPVEILEKGPDDSVLLRFEVYDPSREHHLYLGNAAASGPRKPRRTPQGGLLLEVLELPDGPCESWADAQKLLRASPRRLGWLAPRTIALGVPPLGVTGGFIARYTGFLEVERPGTHKLETASEGASFVLVGGKLVASWPGYHGLAGYERPESRKEHTGSVELAAGIHPIEYVVASRSGTVHVLAWAQPGEEHTHPLSGRHIVPWTAAELGPLQLQGKPAADFDWQVASDTGSDADRHDLAELRFRFAGDLEGRTALAPRWSFGDGQIGEGDDVRHVYLKHGTYTVTCDVALPGGKTLAATRRVAVRFEGLERTDLDGLLEGYFERTRGYDLAALERDQLAQVIWLRSKDDRWEVDLWPAVDAWYSRGLSDPARSRQRIEALGLRRALDLVRAGKDEPLARRILGALAGGAARKEDRDEARARLAGLDVRDPASEAATAAEVTLAELFGSSVKTDAARRAGLFLARLHLQRGKPEEARAILQRLESEDGFRKHAGDRRLSSGARKLSFDNLLREKRLEEARSELERWEWELPVDELGGLLAIERARLLRLEKRTVEALRELEGLRALPAASGEVPRALLLEAEILAEKGDPAKARERLEEVLRAFPQRPESREAAERLEALAGAAAK
ncbi:MAG: PKD domain-containing protein [Planctomycetes bacterium]|nr:PKD domain-containing protein [Planctomycetota bacterium]